MSVGMPHALYLQQFGDLLEQVFGATPYQVGSSVENKTWRDVDVRVILDKEQWEQWGFHEDIDRLQHYDGKWIGLCMAFSELGRKMTGLPIDFQIQEQDWANKMYSEGPKCIRSALGIVPWRLKET